MKLRESVSILNLIQWKVLKAHFQVLDQIWSYFLMAELLSGFIWSSSGVAARHKKMKRKLLSEARPQLHMQIFWQTKLLLLSYIVVSMTLMQPIFTQEKKLLPCYFAFLVVSIIGKCYKEADRATFTSAPAKCQQSCRKKKEKICHQGCRTKENLIKEKETEICHKKTIATKSAMNDNRVIM